MNLLGSQDVERVRSAQASTCVIKDLSREEQRKLSFSEEALEEAIVKEKYCAAIQFAIPGVPSIYYGDEQGMCGVCDPFNRLPFREDRQDLHDYYAELAKRRNSSTALSTGEAVFMAASADVLLILRYIANGEDAFGLPAQNDAWLIAINRGAKDFSFEADCSASGHGLVSNSVEAESAKFIHL